MLELPKKISSFYRQRRSHKIAGWGLRGGRVENNMSLGEDAKFILPLSIVTFFSISASLLSSRPPCSESDHPPISCSSCLHPFLHSNHHLLPELHKKPHNMSFNVLWYLPSNSFVESFFFIIMDVKFFQKLFL